MSDRFVSGVLVPGSWEYGPLRVFNKLNIFILNDEDWRQGGNLAV